MTPDQAADLATRTLAAIAEGRPDFTGWDALVLDADRERVASDLAGLLDHDREGEHVICDAVEWPCPDARRYADGLRRTAALYGVTGREAHAHG